MSIILKGIDLPKDCTECPLEGAEVDDDGFDYWYCKITESMATTIERPSNCPLIQIPKGHGRLIDIEKLKEEFAMKNNICKECDSFKECDNKTYSKSEICEKFIWVPTILEEEGE